LSADFSGAAFGAGLFSVGFVDEGGAFGFSAGLFSVGFVSAGLFSVFGLSSGLIVAGGAFCC